MGDNERNDFWKIPQQSQQGPAPAQAVTPRRRTIASRIRPYIIAVSVVLLAVAAYQSYRVYLLFTIETPGPQYQGGGATTTPTTASTTTDGGVSGTAMPLSVSSFANVQNVGYLHLDSRGRVLASIATDDGSIRAFEDTDGDGDSDTVSDVLTGLEHPYGFFVRCAGESCFLYVAEERGVSRYIYDPLSATAFRGELLVELPAGGDNPERGLMLLSEEGKGRMLIMVPASCNVCTETNQYYASVWEANLDGGDLRRYAWGLRKALHAAVDPILNTLWIVDEGRTGAPSHLSTNEVNRLYESKNYGWPKCYGRNIHDSQFDPNTYVRNPCQEPYETESVISLPADTQPRGIAFVPRFGWPAEYRGAVIVSLDGTERGGTSRLSMMLPVGDGTFEKNSIDLAAAVGAKAIHSPGALVFDATGILYVYDRGNGSIARLRWTGTTAASPGGEFIPLPPPVLTPDPPPTCQRTGCSGQICAAEQVFTTCEWKEEYQCYSFAFCEVQNDNTCGWTPTQKYESCMEDIYGPKATTAPPYKKVR